MNKLCRVCLQTLPVDSFYKGRARCKKCYNSAKKIPQIPVAFNDIAENTDVKELRLIFETALAIGLKTKLPDNISTADKFTGRLGVSMATLGNLIVAASRRISEEEAEEGVREIIRSVSAGDQLSPEESGGDEPEESDGDD